MTRSSNSLLTPTRSPSSSFGASASRSVSADRAFSSSESGFCAVSVATEQPLAQRAGVASSSPISAHSAQTAARAGLRVIAETPEQRRIRELEEQVAELRRAAA